MKKTEKITKKCNNVDLKIPLLLGMLLQNLKKTIIFSLEIIFALDSRIFCKKKL